MKTWWTTTAWPWLRKNWWIVLLSPILLIPFLLSRLGRLFTPEVVVVPDPLEPANERARVEEETRQRALAAEQARLERERQVLAGKHETATAAHEAEAAKDVETLRRDPQALVDRMREVNR